MGTVALIVIINISVQMGNHHMKLFAELMNFENGNLRPEYNSSVYVHLF